MSAPREHFRRHLGLLGPPRVSYAQTGRFRVKGRGSVRNALLGGGLRLDLHSAQRVQKTRISIWRAKARHQTA